MTDREQDARVLLLMWGDSGCSSAEKSSVRMIWFNWSSSTQNLAKPSINVETLSSNFTLKAN
jgi:hypothetical protein